jgi:hypothetical protein
MYSIISYSVYCYYCIVTLWLCWSKYKWTFSAARNSAWTDFICLNKYRNSTRILEKNLGVIENVKVENTLKIRYYLMLTIMAYRMKLRNDGMTKGIELPCRKQNHFSNISLWDQQNDINKKELFERSRRRKENQIKSKRDCEVYEWYNVQRKRD